MPKIAYQRIVVAVDFSAPSKAALRHAIGLAEHHGASIDVIYVIEDYFQATLPWADQGVAHVKEMRARAIQAATEKLEKFVPKTPSVDISCTVKVGEVDEQVHRLASRRQADLIVIANVGRRRMGELLLGSTAADIVRTSKIPVLLVPQP